MWGEGLTSHDNRLPLSHRVWRRTIRGPTSRAFIVFLCQKTILPTMSLPPKIFINPVFVIT